MKKTLKRLAVATTSAIICASSTVALVSNANVVYIVNNTSDNGVRYEEFYSDYFDLTIALKSVDPVKKTEYDSDTGEWYDVYTYDFIHGEHMRDYDTGAILDEMVYGTLLVTVLEYQLPIESHEIMAEYLEENYPELTFEISEGDLTNTEKWQLDSDDQLTIDEKMEVAINIKEALGFYFSYAPCESVDDFEASIVGDVNNDNKVTATDAALVLSYYAKTQVSADTLSANSDEADTFELLGDINNDGKVTATDAALILKQYAESQVG